MWTNPDCEDPTEMAERYFDKVVPLFGVSLTDEQRRGLLAYLTTWMWYQRETGEATMVKVIKGELHADRFSRSSYGLKDYLK